MRPCKPREVAACAKSVLGPETILSSRLTDALLSMLDQMRPEAVQASACSAITAIARFDEIQLEIVAQGGNVGQVGGLLGLHGGDHEAVEQLKKAHTEELECIMHERAAAVAAAAAAWPAAVAFFVFNWIWRSLTTGTTNSFALGVYGILVFDWISWRSLTTKPR